MTTPQRQGFAIGIDLGTSNTVAVVRSPDGRTRPLLFDGQPIMPSTVFLDDSGRIHVGRDAQRMAQLDPARCEPNPKRRIDEPAVLLGDREIPVVHLLSALLREIAGKAVEAVGFLPPAAITHPAAWGPTRRGVLMEAVRQSGWPPVKLVPEPIAAARYFAEVMRRPVPVGSSIAVFDFGGGTLDVAVVRNEGDRFTVVGSGGDERLGGLDLDSALVAHVGGLVGQRHQQIWAHLSQPRSTADRRYRRLFWEDVRGAKEMLSRATTAPVPVPGVDHAVHLTREELERLGVPLLSRAVAATEATLAQTGVRAGELAGLFLVGGSSRVPMVGRMLHAQLGVAPIVLEQPELPVAEGALAELLPPDPNRTEMLAANGMPYPMSAVPASGMPVSVLPDQSSPVSATPASPAGATIGAPPGPYPPNGPYPSSGAPTGFGQQPMPDFGPPPKRPWYKRKQVLIPSGAGVLVLLIVAGFLLLYNPYSERAFSTRKSVGSVPSGVDSPTNTYVRVLGNTAYTMDADSSGEAVVQAVGLSGKIGKPKWRKSFDSGDGSWDTDAGLSAYSNALTLSYDAVGDTPGKYIVIDPADGSSWKATLASNNDTYQVAESAGVVIHKEEDGTVTALDIRNGKKRWGPKKGLGYADLEGGPAMLNAPARFATELPMHGSQKGLRAVFVDSDSNARVVDLRTGKVSGKKQKMSADENTTTGSSGQQLVYNGMLLDMSSETGYRIRAYSLDDPAKSTWVYNGDSSRTPDWLEPCGAKLVCVRDHEGDSDESKSKTAQLVVLKLDDGASPAWTKPAKGLEGAVPVGNRIVVSAATADDSTVTVYDQDGDQQGQVIPNAQAARVDDATVLTANGDVFGGTTAVEQDWTLNGVGVQSGSTTSLGALNVDLSKCEWSDKYIGCPGENKVEFWSFRK